MAVGIDIKQIQQDVEQQELEGPGQPGRGPYAEHAVAEAIKKRNELADGISDARTRDQFITQTDADIQMMQSRLLAKTDDLWHERERTNTLRSVEEVAKTALIADPNRVGEISQGIRTQLEGAFELGHFRSYEDYQNTVDGAMNSIQFGRWKGTEDLTEKRQILDDMKSGKIENRLSADTLIQMEAQMQDDEEKAWALNESDRIVAANQGDYGAAIDDARGIQDADRRDRVIQRINAAKAQDDAAKNQVQQDLFEKYAFAMEEQDGFTYDDIPYEDRQMMTNRMRDDLRRVASTRRPSVSNYDVVLNFYRIADKGYGEDNLQVMQQYLRENSSSLSTTDMRKFMDIARGQVDLWDSGITDTQRIGGYIEASKIPKGKKNQFMKDLGDWQTNFRKNYGRPPTDEEKNKFLDALTMNIVKEQDAWGWIDDEEYGYDLEGPYREALNDAIDAVVLLGEKPTKERVQGYFDKLKKDRGLE